MNGENHSEHDLNASNSKYTIPYIYSRVFQELIKLVAKTVDGTITSKFGKFIPAAVLATSVGMTAGFWKLEQDSITQDVSNQLDKQLLEASYPVISRIHDYEQILLSIQGLFKSSNIVTREENRSFMNSLNLGINFPEIVRTSISFYVRDGKTTDSSNGKPDNYTTTLNEEGFLNLDASRKGENAKTAYVEPFIGDNLSSLAYDNFSDSIRRTMLRLSQYKDEAVLSNPIHLDQETKKEDSPLDFLIAYPIYVKRGSHSTQDERDKNLLGWATISFDFGKLIPQASPNSFSDMNLQIYVGDGEDEKTLIFNSSPLGEVITQPRLSKSKTITVANKDFTFVVNSTESLERNMFYKGYLNTILYSGALVTFLLTISTYFFIRGRKESLNTIKELNIALDVNRHLAEHDELTDLPNRVGFLNRLKSDIHHAAKMNTSVGLMFIDLDKFKHVNDTYGHHIGDELLKEVARRMKEFMRYGDTIGRKGGDEFLVIIPDLKDPKNISIVARKIIDSLSEVFKIEGHAIHIGCSIGSAVYPRDAHDIDILQKNAEIAMYAVKDSSRNAYRGYSDGMQEKIEEYQLYIGVLHHALEVGGFTTAFQPVIDLKTDDIIGMEALLRCNNPELGSIPPAKLIPIAEKSGLIVPIGKWIIRDVCEQIVKWREQGIHAPKIAVNLSAKQFLTKTLFEDIMQIIKETGVSPRQIGLEITEGTLFHNMDDAIGTFHKFKNAGFEISIDDFGTGFSNLSYLARFDVSILKIDRAFILEMHTKKGLALVKSIINAAHSLGMQTIAEGVESKDIVRILRESGCDNVQGYVFGKPENAEMTSSILSSKNNYTVD